jgi:hypothetical protein
MSIKAALNNLFLAYKQKRYYLITLLIAAVFYSFTALLNNTRAIWFGLTNQGIFPTIKLTFLLIINYAKTITTISAATLTIISLLLGVLFALIIFKHIFFNNPDTKKKAGILATIGAVLGALAPGCAFCGVGIFYALGFGSAFITLLPLQGIEFSLVSIIILLVSIYLLAKNLTYCKIHPKKEIKQKKK